MNKRKVNLLIYPGFVTDVWCRIEQRYVWLVKPLEEHFNVYWLVPPAGSKHVRCVNEANRNKEPIYVTKLREQGAKIIVADISKYNLLSNIILLKNIFKKYQIDAVSQYFSPLGYYVELVAALMRLKVVRKEHGLTFHSKRKYKLIKWLFWRLTTTYYISVSRAVDAQLQRMHLCSKNNHYVVYDGIDVDELPVLDKASSRKQLQKKYGFSSDANLLVCVGRINSNKRQHLLIDMLHQINDRNTLLFLVGANTKLNYAARLSKMIARYGLREQVYMTGYVDHPMTYLNAADIVYLPSEFEGFPNSTLEAYIYRSPVIASNLEPFHEFILDGQSGYLIDDNSISDYYHRTKELLSDSNKRRRMSELGREIVLPLISKKRFVQESVQAYKYALKH